MAKNTITQEFSIILTPVYRVWNDKEGFTGLELSVKGDCSKLEQLIKVPSQMIHPWDQEGKIVKSSWNQDLIKFFQNSFDTSLNVKVENINVANTIINDIMVCKKYTITGVETIETYQTVEEDKDSAFEEEISNISFEDIQKDVEDLLQQVNSLVREKEISTQTDNDYIEEKDIIIKSLQDEIEELKQQQVVLTNKCAEYENSKNGF